jgi:signal transduction histidine kinase
MDSTEQALRQNYDEVDGEIQLRTQELADFNNLLRAEIAILATSLDFRTTIVSLARLAVSRLADWCAVFMFENEQTIRRITVMPVEAAEALYPLDLHVAAGPGHVFRTGEHEVSSSVTDEILESFGLKPTQSFLLDGRKPASYLCVPLSARGRTIGAMAFIAFDSRRLYAETQIAMARDLACAAAVAMDNAKLYREAQEANRLKDEFVAMVSHELRTPLTPILGCIHLLRTANLSEASFARALEIIERNAHAQVQIVEDLLDVSRIVAGKLHLAMKSIQVTPVVSAAIDSVRPMAEAKGIQIITMLEDVQHPIDGDPDRLQQVVWNLLSNAVKFTPPEGRIAISVRRDNDHILVEVTDTGVGIPSDFLPYIFDRFRQGNESSAKMRSGLGLGLAIVRHLVELHHGSIEAASPGIGQGAIFTLKFPFQTRKAAIGTS